MAYVPFNLNVYTAAFGGAIAGAGVPSGAFIIDPVSGDYAPVANVAAVFAQAVDTAWGAGLANQYDIDAIEEVCTNILTKGNGAPMTGVTTTQGNWTIVAMAIVALVRAGDTKAIADGITFPPTSGATISALVSLYAVNWAVTDWYIDGIIGDDVNNGTTVITPLKTGTELLRRLGSYALWSQSVTVHVLDNGMTDGLVLRGCMLLPKTHLDVLGTVTRLASDTIGSYSALNHATPTGTQITGNAIVDWTPYQWRRIRITAGPRAGNIVWIACANPAGVGVATARVTVPIAIDTASLTTIYSSGTALVFGDSFDVESLPNVPSIELLVDGPFDLTAGSQWDRRQMSIRDISCPKVETRSAADAALNKSTIFGCRLTLCTLGGFSTGNLVNIATASGCLFFQNDPAKAGRLEVYLRTANCLFGDGVLNSTYVVPLSSGNALHQGGAFTSLNYHAATSLQVFDYAGVVVGAVNLLNGSIGNLSGSNNAGYGILVPNSTNVRLFGTINITGALSPARLSSAPAINLTLAQLLQPNDYSQRGTATIGASGAGFVDVVVPWWDPTTQRLTVTPKNLLGTPGTLSCPGANRTNTGFRILSSNVLDVSTVDWFISPLGRNISISTV